MTLFNRSFRRFIWCSKIRFNVNGQAQLVSALGNLADGFKAAVNTALEQIRSTEIGPSLLRAIEGTGPEVLILKAGQNVDNTRVQSLQTESACDAACYEQVLSNLKLREKFRSRSNGTWSNKGTPPS